MGYTDSISELLKAIKPYVLKWSGNRWVTIIKPSSQSVTNSDVLVDDTVLKFTTLPNTIYSVRMRAYCYTNDATADFKYRLTHTGTTTWIIGTIHRGGAGADPAEVARSAFDTSDVALLSASTGLIRIEENFTVSVGAYGGVIKFQFAQNTATAGKTVISEPGNYIEYAVVY